MKLILQKIFILISLFYFLAAPGVAIADCPTGEDVTEESCVTNSGCVYAAETCKPCGTGKYRKKENNKYICTDCTKRPDGAEWTGNGGDSDNCRWKITCPNKPGFEHGIWEPDSPTATGTGSTSTCTYNFNKITCDTTGNETCSKLGYHLNTAGNACVSDVSSCGNGGLGLRFYGDNTCYYKTCGSLYTLNPKKQCNSDENEYGTCELNLISCSSKLSASLCKNETNNDNGQIDGDASLVVSDFSYNYENCTCTKQASIENGTGTKKCYFNSDGTAAATNCQTTLATCNTGYCNTSGLQCATVPAGQYSLGTSKECLSCTPGATSAAGSTNKSACHYTNQTTFKDTAGTFTLPDDDDNIKIEWSWGN